MNIFNGSEKFESRLISEFAQTVSDNEDIELLSECRGFIVGASKQHDNLAECFLSALKSDEVVDDDIFRLKAANSELLFKGSDYKWWSKTKKRIEKFNELLLSKTVDQKRKTKKEIKSEDEQIYNVAVAYDIDNCLSCINHFIGQKSKAIEFINNDIFEKYKASSINAKIVVNLAFDEKDFCRIFSEGTEEEKYAYRRNLEMWYTLSELEEIGALTLK